MFPKMKRVVFGLVAVSPLLVMGCAVNLEPAVASFNEASVGIQLDGNSMDFADKQSKAAAIAKADAKAAEICSRGPNRKAEYASSRRIPTGQYSYVTERLYLCLK